MRESVQTEARNRARSMTDGSAGSFAAYLAQENEEPNLEKTSTMMADESMIVPTEAFINKVANSPREEEMAQESCQWQAGDALKVLRQLSEGIQIISRQMKHSHSCSIAEDELDEEERENNHSQPLRARSWSDSCSIQSCTGDDERRLSELARQLEGTLGADLMSLSHAAQMLKENSRMVSEESSLLLRDTQEAQEASRKAISRANKAESAVKILYKRQKGLSKELQKTKNERGVLKRQVMTLMEENESLTKQIDSVRTLELHVAGALHAHERQLALIRAKRDAENRTDGPAENVATVRLDCDGHGEQTTTTTKEETKCHEDHFAAKNAHVSKALQGSQEREAFVEVASNSVTKDATQTSEPSKPVFAPSKENPRQESGKVGGFGGTIGFGGFGIKRTRSWRERRAKPPRKASEEAEKTVDTVSADEPQEAGPTLITPTNSVDMSVEPTPSESCNEELGATNQGADGNVQEAPSPENGIVPEKIAVSQQEPGEITPSPTDRTSGPMKTFFRRGNRERACHKEHFGRKDMGRVYVRRPLLHLDEASVDPTEQSHECPSALETADSSTTPTSSSPTFYDHGFLPSVQPPKSLELESSGEVSPFTPHEHVPPTDVLDEKIIRSLAIPGMIVHTPENKDFHPVPLQSPNIPPEIAQIYEEISTLHEC